MALLRSAIWCGSYGDLLPVEMALLRLRCEECQHSEAEARLCRCVSQVAASGDKPGTNGRNKMPRLRNPSIC